MRKSMNLLLFCALATAFIAQGTPQPAPVFTAGIELVRLDIRVTDGQGRPIADLRQDEVEIVENGEHRPVVFFQHIEEPAESYLEVASRTVAGEVSTNQGAARGHLYVLVFDQLHILPGNEQRVRLAAQRFVETRLRPGDRVALFALPGPGPQIAFTSDARRIAAELMKVRGLAQPQAFGALGSMTLNEAFQIARGNEQILQRVADRFQSQAAPTDIQRRADSSAPGGNATPFVALVKEDARRIADIADGETRRFLALFADVLRPLRAIEGRKTILFVSEGFYADRLARELDDVAAAAAESYSVINALDVNRRGPDIMENEPAIADQAAGIHDRTTPLGSLAAETGGTLILDASQHADQAFAAVGDQSQDYYLVGFAPGNRALKGRGAYRPVTVRVRRSGAQVSTRSGFTLADAAARMDRHQALDRAMSAPFSLQGLPIQYTTYVLRGSTTGLHRIILSLAVELPIDTRYHNQPADVVFVVRSAAGGGVAASGHDVIRLPDRRTAASTTGTGTYRVQFEVPPGDYLMRAVVREPGGLVGSADRRFTVRALEGPALTSGDLVLSSMRGDLPVRATAYTNDGLSGVLELYGRTTDQLLDARVTVDLVPIGQSNRAVSAVADLQEIRTIGGGAAREARIDVPLQGLTPGMYVARARVTVGADTMTEVVREVEIRPGKRATTTDETGEGEFNPSEVVNGALAREYADALRAAAGPGTVDALRGLDRLAARDYPAAIAAFEASLTATSTNGAAAFFLGWAFHGAGDDRRAISAWRRAVFTDPALVPAHLALADMYLRLSQPALAIQALRAGLTALPRSPELLDRLSRLERR
jgi:VWFA-related protein